MSIKRYSAAYRSTNECDEGFYVLHEDHVASHAYDEAKERELFTAFAMERFLSVHRGESRDYLYSETETAWLGWKACAKSRARSA